MELIARKIEPSGDDLGGYSIETPDGRRIAFVWPYEDEIRINGKMEPITPFGARDPEGFANLFASAREVRRELESLLAFIGFHRNDIRDSASRGLLDRLIDDAQGAIEASYGKAPALSTGGVSL
jgi:hypothetical protein